MIIRPVTKEDRGAIRRLMESTGTFTSEEVRVAMEVVEDALARPGEEAEYTVLCAVDGDGECNGYICFGPIPMTDHRYDLYWIATDRGRFRQGVGGELLQAMTARVAARKGKRIYVDTSSTPPYGAAREFYEKHGFHLAGALPDFYREGDSKMIYMKEI